MSFEDIELPEEMDLPEVCAVYDCLEIYAAEVFHRHSPRLLLLSALHRSLGRYRLFELLCCGLGVGIDCRPEVRRVVVKYVCKLFVK